MTRIGIWLIIFGVGSFLLNLLNMEFILLMWIDSWGPTVGLLIRGGLVAVGIVLIAVDKMRGPRISDDA